MAMLVLDRYQAHEIELARRLEQHACLVQRFALGCVHRPSSVAQREIDVGCMSCFIASPFAHRPRVGELAWDAGERCTDLRLELRTQCGAVEASSDVGPVAVERLALDDLALAREQRSKLVLRLL